MKTLNEIKAEIQRATERRAELCPVASQGHDSKTAAEVRELEDRIQRLWDEERLLRAHLRFGDRDEIIKRARHEERLARAAYPGEDSSRLDPAALGPPVLCAGEPMIPPHCPSFLPCHRSSWPGAP